ncbi:MAG TPA: PEP-CTERM sorting domain-containing protein [Anaerohalosphaeraceae bacterium]|nr:PEP-CTERM sorting domain-containing protein [Anaerohalosphaeraceae bacterium]HPB93607.1 PEP-CTERM sorting domain-containing protein [Anaerohalosphaeraceae bacterium]HRT23959.1 PEP-CTERM sorting domain-containing protein [Anaerohalosphaeraceae bacterium]HRU15608.1 PEP-CTERM sorting domain-containing protein [Anaerohalosphaeraceae bacterium]
MKNKLIVLALLGLLAMSVQAPALVIGNWESMPASGDGWIDWGQGQAAIETLPEKYSSSTIGATLGSKSLRVDQSGWAQSLAIKLNAEQRAVFMKSSTFSMDVSVRANDGTITGGYSQIYAVYMNAAGPGWTEVAGGNPVNFYWWPGSGQRTATLTVDYSAFRDQITSTGYIEIILALNTGGGAPTDMYFDNAQLTGVPEPATLALLGTGCLLTLRKRK